MKYERANLKRKEQMALSLKKLLEQKDLQKITVQEIADDCGINRYTFYYHFKDIYDLLSWAFQNETLAIIKKNENCLTWQEGFQMFLRHNVENRQVFRRILDGVGTEMLWNLFYQEISHLMDAFLLDVKGSQEISEDYWQFLRNFYIGALCGVLMDWLRQDTPISEDTFMAYLQPLMSEPAIQETLRQAELDEL